MHKKNQLHAFNFLDPSRGSETRTKTISYKKYKESKKNLQFKKTLIVRVQNLENQEPLKQEPM